MADDLRFDGHNLEQLARGMHHAATGFREAVQPELNAIGVEIAAAARQVAGEHSKSIPATIKTRPLPGAVAVTAGDEATPIAALHELGNKGSPRSAETFRHPVFGRGDAWVTQAKHPYLRPALAAGRREIGRRMERAWDHALRKAGIRVE